MNFIGGLVKSNFKYLMLILSFLCIFQLIGIYNAEGINYYSVDWFSTRSPSIPNPTIHSPNTSISEMDIDMFVNADVYGTPPFSATISYYSPHGTLLATTTRAFSSNQSCTTFGSVNATTTETMATITSDALGYDATLTTRFEISPSVRDITFNGLSSANDSSNNMLNEFFYTHATATVNAVDSQNKVDALAYGHMLNFTKYNDCNSVVYPSGRYNETHSFPTGSEYSWIMSRYFIFNSSANGLLNYSYDFRYPSLSAPCGTFIDGYYKTGYYKYADNPTWQDVGTGQADSDELTLDANTIYIFQMTVGLGYSNGGADENDCVMQEPRHVDNFTINTYLPTFICGDWSKCDNGIQYHNCVDSGGESPDRIEYQSCYSLPERTVSLGFENASAVDVFYSYPEWWVIGCPYFLGHKVVKYPLEWNLNNISNPLVYDNGTFNMWGYSADNLEISTFESVEGTNSLKMWSLPPEMYLPMCTDGSTIENKTCELTPYGNYTFAQVPTIYEDINETFLLSKNMTFDYPNVSLSMYIKKCNEPVQEWAGNSSLFGFCGDGYYTPDKSSNWDIEDTRVFLYIYDINDSIGITYARFIADNENWEKKELRLENMSTTHLYRFYLGISPESPVDTNVYCAYIDNVELNAYSGSLPCESNCNGSTRYTARQIYDYACVYDIEPVSKLCTNEQYFDEIEDCSSHCVCEETSSEYLAYRTGDNSTSICEWTVETNSDYCVSKCAELIDVENISDDLQDLLDDSGVGFLGNFFSATMIILFILLAIAGFVAVKLDKSWQIFVVMMIIQLMVVSFLWSQFTFIGIIISILLAIFLAKVGMGQKIGG